MYSSSLSARFTLLALLSASTLYFLYKSRRLRALNLLLSPKPKPSRGKLFFISQTGTSKTLASRLHSVLASCGLHFDLADIRSYEPEDISKESLVLIVASTWEEGKPPDNAAFFTSWLSESAADFRVGSLLLSHCQFAVFGVGSSAYGATFNAVAKDLSKKFKALGAKEMISVTLGDVDGGELDGIFEIWSNRVIEKLRGCGGLSEDEGLFNGGVSDGESSVDGFESDEEEDGESNGGTEPVVVDLEDIAGKGPSRKSSSLVSETNGRVNGKRDMVTPVIRASLEKQVSNVFFCL